MCQKQKHALICKHPKLLSHMPLLKPPHSFAGKGSFLSQCYHINSSYLCPMGRRRREKHCGSSSVQLKASDKWWIQINTKSSSFPCLGGLVPHIPLSELCPGEMQCHQLAFVPCQGSQPGPCLRTMSPPTAILSCPIKIALGWPCQLLTLLTPSQSSQAGEKGLKSPGLGFMNSSAMRGCNPTGAELYLPAVT